MKLILILNMLNIEDRHTGGETLAMLCFVDLIFQPVGTCMSLKGNDLQVVTNISTCCLLLSSPVCTSMSPDDNLT